MSRRRGRCSSTGATRGSAASSGCTRTSAMCCRRRTCSPARCWKICATASRERDDGGDRSGGQGRLRRRDHRATAGGLSDATVGEGGNSLSTGEKQLLSFARALLADPRIFVLDEATSLRRYRHGAAHPGRHREGHGRAHVVYDRAPPLHHPPRGRHPRCATTARSLSAAAHRRAHGEKGRVLRRSTPASTEKSRSRHLWKTNKENSIRRTQDRRIFLYTRKPRVRRVVQKSLWR